MIQLFKFRERLFMFTAPSQKGRVVSLVPFVGKRGELAISLFGLI